MTARPARDAAPRAGPRRGAGPGLRAALLTLVLGAACADLCAQAPEVGATYAERASGCDAGTSALAFDVSACRRGLPRCTDDDLATLGGYYACVEALPSCTPSARAAFAAQVAACAAPMVTLSPGCFVP